MAKMVKIDKTKLDNELRKRGLTNTDVSKELGFHNGYISDAMHRERIGVVVLRMLEVLYNISPDSYVIEDKKEKIEIVDNELKETINYEKLYNLVYTAVYEAVKKAWAE